MSDRAILPFDAEFLDPMDEVSDHMLAWWLFRARNPKCLNPVLPAELVRIPDISEPSVGLEQGSGRHPAAAAQGAPGVGTAPPQGPVIDWATMAAAHTVAPLYPGGARVQQHSGKIRAELEAIRDAHCAQLLVQNLTPLPKPAELESEDSHSSKVT